jgi:hypothetical protein
VAGDMGNAADGDGPSDDPWVFVEGDAAGCHTMLSNAYISAQRLR